MTAEQKEFWGFKISFVHLWTYYVSQDYFKSRDLFQNNPSIYLTVRCAWRQFQGGDGWWCGLRHEGGWRPRNSATPCANTCLHHNSTSRNHYWRHGIRPLIRVVSFSGYSLHFNSRLQLWFVWTSWFASLVFFLHAWHAAFHWLTRDLCGLQISLQIRLMRPQLSLNASLLIHKEFKAQSVIVRLCTHHYFGFNDEYQH